MAERFFEIMRPAHRWADYGDILVHGMSMHLEHHDGLIQLERTGPFIPPISFPGVGDIVVTDALRRHLEGLSGVVFRPVLKTRIVHLEWEKWDQTLPDPPQYPEDGEPEGYILERPHDQKVSEAMGEVWQLTPMLVDGLYPKGRRVELSKQSGLDFFAGTEFKARVFISERCRDRFALRYAECVDFKEVGQSAG